MSDEHRSVQPDDEQSAAQPSDTLHMTNQHLIARRIMVALDVPTEAEAKQILIQLAGIPCTVKVGMQLFYATGPDFIRQLKALGYSVFLDLKLHDIPNTVKGAADSITRLGVELFNVHAAGGLSMMQAALAGVHQAMQSMTNPPSHPPVVIGVTQLTSTDQKTMNEQIGLPGSVQDVVLRYAELCQQAGLQGVVASAQEVPLIKQTCGTSFLTVTPGIRIAGDDVGDQSRVMTPEQAFAVGADYIVVGRSITAAEQPRARLEFIIRSLQKGAIS
jgi:orotidine-5'-phosphate decarboxylase